MTRIRLLSINLLVDRANPADLRSVVGEAEPDVICVQELGESTKAVIADLLPHGRLEAREDCFGLGIATRYPVAIESLEMEERPGWVARLEPPEWPGLGEPLDIVNVHLSNPVDRPWGESRARRRRQVEKVARAVKDRNGASVVIGDMNATPMWHEYKMLAEIGADAARVTGTEARTWSHFLAGPRLLRIDHAFVAGAQPVSTSTVRVKGTDHSALIVDIEL